VTLRAGGAALAAIMLAAWTARAEPAAISFANLAGWAAEDHAAALAAFRETCGAAADPAMARPCRQARSAGRLDAVSYKHMTLPTKLEV
jgi:hypothetical protein